MIDAMERTARPSAPASGNDRPDEAFRVPDGDTRCWSHFLKCLHFALLKELPGSLVTRFWQKFTLEEGGSRLGGRLLADALVARPFLLPMAFVEQVFAEVEPFLASHDACGRKFADTFGEVSVRSFEMPAILLFESLSRLESDPVRPVDSLKWLLWMKARIISLLAPAIDCVPVEGPAAADGCRYLVINHDRHGDGSFRGWDPQFFGCSYLEQLLRLNGLPDAGPVEVVASCLAMERLADGAEVRRDGEELLVDGKVHGRRAGFRDFLSGQGILIPNYPVRDREVMVCVEDFRCARRQRVTLARSIAYGAPFTLLRIRETASRSAPITCRDLIDRIVDTTRKTTGYLGECRKRHHLFMHDDPLAYGFVFHEEKETIYLNGVRIISGLGARILGRIVSDFVEAGKRDFSNRELKSDAFIGAAGLNTNFEVRLTRVMERLKMHCAMLRIHRTRSGHFRMEFNHPVTLKVVAHGDKAGLARPADARIHRVTPPQRIITGL